jgi:thioredoxin family protein
MLVIELAELLDLRAELLPRAQLLACSLEYKQTEQAIRDLLAEAGRSSLGTTTKASPEGPSHQVETSETYLGYVRAERFLPRPPAPGTHDYGSYDGDLPPSHFALQGGVWRVGRESATTVRSASLKASFEARRVFIVLSSRKGRPRRLRVLLDGRPIGAHDAGEDVRAGFVTVRRQRLYRLVALESVERHRLTLDLEPGISGYAFTFG